jgi:hypothetical protein
MTKRYRIQFIGRKIDAIGVYYPIDLVMQIDNLETQTTIKSDLKQASLIDVFHSLGLADKYELGSDWYHFGVVSISEVSP